MNDQELTPAEEALWSYIEKYGADTWAKNKYKFVLRTAYLKGHTEALKEWNDGYAQRSAGK